MLNSRVLSGIAALAAVVALVVSLTAPRSEGQFIHSAQQIGNWWPPHPRDQVQFFADLTTISAGADLEVYVVPQDRWLVIVPTGGASGMSGGPDCVLLEERASQIVKKANQSGYNPTAGGPYAVTALGWTFSPGSRVLVRNTGNVPQQVFYSLFGYLTPP